ncbi:MAG: FAD-dependent oxidoreductase, partial [Acidobacteria bacterium]
MAETYDVAVVGGGLNGLICAACLARAGRSVVVLERRDVAGGVLAVEEFAPGFRAAPWPTVETLAPEILHQLDLAGHGLRLAEPAGVLVAGGGRPLYLPPPGGPHATRVARAIAGVSRSDAAAFERFDAFLRRLAAAVAPLLAQPLPDLEPAGAGGWLKLLRPAWRLRRLGREELAEALRFLPMPLADVAGERFETEALRLATCAGGLRGSWLGPRSPGGAALLLLHRCGLARGAAGHPRPVAGGSLAG